MAVFTPVSRAQLIDFLEDYDLGTLESFEGIKQGTDNSNFHVWTNKGRYILTLFEQRIDPADLPFFFAYTDHLFRKGIRCPRALPGRDGTVISELAGRPAALVSFLDGHGLETGDINDDLCAQVGDLVACMHLAVSDFTMIRPNPVGLSRWTELAEKTRASADDVMPGLGVLIADEIAFLEKNIDAVALPKGVVHADIFPDNVFFRVGTLYGMIDFYFSCTDYFAYDLAIAVNAWCFDKARRFRSERYKAMMDAYSAVRPLSDAERAQFPVLCRAAALRFLMTRLHDWLFRDPSALYAPKDPGDYIERLKFFRDDKTDR